MIIHAAAGVSIYDYRETCRECKAVYHIGIGYCYSFVRLNGILLYSVLKKMEGLVL